MNGDLHATILIIEDDAQLGTEIVDSLGLQGFKAKHVADGTTGIQTALQDRAIELVITDYQLPGIGGLEILESLRSHRPNVPVVMMTAHGSSNLAIKAMGLGAFDYLLKPFGMADLKQVVIQALHTARLTRAEVQLGFYDDAVEGDFMIGRSAPMQKVFKEIGKLAARDVSVLIQGETGTGKELVARALFQNSNRAQQPFIAVNCAAIPANLLESELFGHEKGAFTGAVARKMGRFEQASGGTLFLDEVGEMPLETQSKLLRVLQEQKIQRVGGTQEIAVDTRIVAATNKDLRHEASNSRFREDLLYRLAGSTIHLPPLRERGDDCLRLTNYFLKRTAEQLHLGNVPSIESGVEELLLEHSWPGNVRQLENVLRSALLDAQGFALTKDLVQLELEQESKMLAHSSEQLPVDLRAMIVSMLDDDPEGGGLPSLIERLERCGIEECLRRCDGNQSAAAAMLGISRATLIRKGREFGCIV
ncbi:MAG: sigma-54-dependent Fis family transcriptional regulator [Verrucomicrobiae bacterium]|nr:sigma-54-dependent Fis family transcriptional regulator [Verrucomicrobiae bacterium]